MSKQRYILKKNSIITKKLFMNRTSRKLEGQGISGCHGPIKTTLICTAATEDRHIPTDTKCSKRPHA